MFCCCLPNKPAESLQEQSERNMAARMIHLLMLGAGECGKSTVMKQIRIIYCGGFSDSSKMEFVPIIRENAIRSIGAILSAMITLRVQLKDRSLVALGEQVLDFYKQYDHRKDSTIPKHIVTAVEKLWEDENLQTCTSRSNEYQLLSNYRYFLEKIATVAMEYYVPTIQDIINSRAQTLTVDDQIFHLQTGRIQRSLRIIDVGGQRGQRRKWIHTFDHVTSLLWVAALSDYDLVLEEDQEQKKNRMEDSLQMFESVVNYPIMFNKSIVLFLNKVDLFREKLARSPVYKYFPDCPREASFHQAREFFSNQFSTKNKNVNRNVYIHYTCATDTESLAYLLSTAVDTIIKESLQKAGLVS